MASTVCDGCRETVAGPRVTITTEASEDGVNVEVTKRWILCRPCGDRVFSRIGETSPWIDDDFKTVVMPDDELMSQQAGGYAAQVR
jgi:hypothetical protein